MRATACWLDSENSDLAARQAQIDGPRRAVAFAGFATIPCRAAEIAAAEINTDGVLLGHAEFARPGLLDLYLRQALEQAWLQRAGAAPAAAAMAAARAAAMFITGEQDRLHPDDLAALPDWVGLMAADMAPAAPALAAAWPAATPSDIKAIRQIWHLLGTAEALMETGGDIRLARDPRSALNGYGCSHRPRPWAITFASSTASSSSERGYAAADLARLRTTAAMLQAGGRGPIRSALGQVRDGLAAVYGLPADGAVVLAASGTDTELFALALTHLAAPGQPILNILIAPEETGSGVPMAALGLHFAMDTALGHEVAREAPIDGFRADTALCNVALRLADGTVRPQTKVETEIEAAVATGIAAGRRVILHGLDLSKTGLLAPSLRCLRRLRAAHGAKFDIVIDACQARLSPASAGDYLQLGATVLVTGSKFFTGPPFAGAILLPPAVAARLRSGALPAGLDAYFGRDEFPEDCAAAEALPAVGNYGLALRWFAAMAEIAALLAVAPQRRAEILRAFGAVVRDQVAAHPALALLPVPPVERGAEEWERCQSIFGFFLSMPNGRYLRLDEARAVYVWLNADLRPSLPGLNDADQLVAARICHIGQPVKLPAPSGRMTGVLRVSAGARLISGEPSHQGLADAARVERELSDLRIVFAKIGLILRHFEALEAAAPAPCYRL